MSELTAYAVFLGILFAVVALSSLSYQSPQGRSTGMSLYAFTVVCGAVLLGTLRSYQAALYCSTAPPAAFAYFFFFGFHPNLSGIDQIAIIAFIAVWVAYTVRVVKMARRYPEMPEGDASGKPRNRRHWWRRNLK